MAEFRDVYTALRQPTGRILQRGLPSGKEDFFLGVCVWLRRPDGKYLISKRASVKSNFPLKWEPTGGGVLAGETTLEAAKREVFEELGLTIDMDQGSLFCTTRRLKPVFSSNSFEDVYLFEGDWPLSDVRFQEDETCDAKWATPEEIRALIARDEFVPARYYPYLDWLFGE